MVIKDYGYPLIRKLHINMRRKGWFSLTHTSLYKQLLITLVALQLVTGLVFLAVPFVQSLNPPEFKRILDYDYSLRIDLGEMEEESLYVYSWQGVPIGVLIRSKKNLDNLEKMEQYLANPFSEQSKTLPRWTRHKSIDVSSDFLKTRYRSVQSNIFVVTMVSPESGCMVKLVKADEREKYGFPSPWYGGFLDPCNGKVFDLSGRIFRSKKSDKNLLIPKYGIHENQFLILKP